MSCKHLPATEEQIKQAIIEALADGTAFAYDKSKDAEMHKDRAMQCLDPTTFKLPYWTVHEKSEEIYVDCPEGGMILIIPDFFEVRKNTDLNLSLIPGYRRPDEF